MAHEAESFQDEDSLCQWMEEALGQKPKSWEANSVYSFNADILGDGYMQKGLVLRACYVQICAILTKWLGKKFELETPRGLFVITGTPGMGKSVLLGYIAVYLADEYDLVIRRNYTWYSRQAGPNQKTVKHKEEPQMLQKSSTVLLIDPVGGKTTDDVKHRARGCTIVFISLRMKPYHSAFSQSAEHATRLYQPIWSKSELEKHHSTLFKGQSQEDVQNAHDLLGGSVRWLRRFFKLVGEGKKPDEAARELIRECIHDLDTFESLEKLVRQAVPSGKADTKESLASALLQIDANHSDTFSIPSVQLIDSEAAREEICNKLQITSAEHQRCFVDKFLHMKELSILVGNVFQRLVMGRLTTDVEKALKLQCRPLASTKGEKGVECEVPNHRLMMQTKGASPLGKLQLSTNQLYIPISKTFPAADAFFATAEKTSAPITYRLWLLQVTKNEKEHKCKIGPMHNFIKNAFLQLDMVSDISWVIIAPKGIASNYSVTQNVEGEWIEGTSPVGVSQYVVDWDTKP